MNVSLILVDLDDPSAEWQTNIRLAIESTTKRLYVYFEGTYYGLVFISQEAKYHVVVWAAQGSKHMLPLTLACLPCWHDTTTKLRISDHSWI